MPKKMVDPIEEDWDKTEAEQAEWAREEGKEEWLDEEFSVEELSDEDGEEDPFKE